VKTGCCLEKIFSRKAMDKKGLVVNYDDDDYDDDDSYLNQFKLQLGILIIFIFKGVNHI
jgi:hypothetical protein